MDGKCINSAIQLRHRDALKTPKRIKPPKKTVTVSAAAVFKKQRLDTPQLRSTSRSPQKSTVKNLCKKRQEELHPLAITFKETSEDYRRHLYSTAVVKINQDLDVLLKRLYENNLQVASSDPAGSGSPASPLQLTAPAKYQRIIQKLCNPLSSHRYGLQRTNAAGEIECAQTTLHDRFRSFEDYMRAETQQIKELQRQWEGIVAEIFQLGVNCLGEEDMAALLSTGETETSASSPGPKADSTLIVPEHCSSANKGKGKRKRVSFASPNMMSMFPDFLFHMSGYQREPISAAPELPHVEVERLKENIADLGKYHVTDLQRLEKEDQEWWKRKQTQLAHTFMQD